SHMSLQPLWPYWLSIATLVALLVLGIWQLIRARGVRRLDWLRRSLVVVLLGGIALGPSVETRVSHGLISNADLPFVVDRTGSTGALDYADGGTRLRGVAADIDDLTRVFPAASYSIISFDSMATQQLPLTTDARAVKSWADTLTQERTMYSAGS